MVTSPNLIAAGGNGGVVNFSAAVFSEGRRERLTASVLDLEEESGSRTVWETWRS
jgi:hypothetical protein